MGSFLEAFDQGMNLAHMVENDKRLREVAQRTAALQQMQMLELAQGLRARENMKKLFSSQQTAIPGVAPTQIESGTSIAQPSPVMKSLIDTYGEKGATGIQQLVQSGVGFKEAVGAFSKKKTPTTAMGKFLLDYPNKTPEQVAQYNQSLKSKTKLTVGPDGQVMFEQGGGGMDMTAPTKSKLQKGLVGLIDQQLQLESVGENIFKETLTLPGQLKRKSLEVKDWLGMKITPENKEFLGNARVFIESLEQFFNVYRKEITGAQAAMKELAMLRDSILNKKVTPTEFEYSFKRSMKITKRAIRIKRMLLSQGIPEGSKEMGRRIDEYYQTGNQVPDSEINRRGDQLRATGLGDSAVLEQLTKEGYID